MKIDVYKMFYICDENPTEVFYQTDVLSERELRKEFYDCVTEYRFNDATIKEYGLENITMEQVNDMELNRIIEIIESDGYEIQQCEVFITEEDLHD